MRYPIARYMRVALLFLGSALLLFSCGGKEAVADRRGEAAMMTEYSENLSIVMSQNGRRSYFFETPQLEGYTLGNEPYREFRRGIKITTYQDDSLTTVNAVLTANYAIYYEERELWEAKGNVEVHKYDGTEVYTQQLFWNARTKQIYSNVDTKLVKGNNVTVGERFESDEDFKDWRFRYQKSRMEVEMAPTDPADSTAAPRPRTDRSEASAPQVRKPRSEQDPKRLQRSEEELFAPMTLEEQPDLRSKELQPTMKELRPVDTKRTTEKSRLIQPAPTL